MSYVVQILDTMYLYVPDRPSLPHTLIVQAPVHILKLYFSISPSISRPRSLDNMLPPLYSSNETEPGTNGSVSAFALPAFSRCRYVLGPFEMTISAFRKCVGVRTIKLSRSLACTSAHTLATISTNPIRMIWTSNLIYLCPRRGRMSSVPTPDLDFPFPHFRRAVPPDLSEIPDHLSESFMVHTLCPRLRSRFGSKDRCDRMRFAVVVKGDDLDDLRRTVWWKVYQLGESSW